MTITPKLLLFTCMTIAIIFCNAQDSIRLAFPQKILTPINTRSVTKILLSEKDSLIQPLDIKNLETSMRRKLLDSIVDVKRMVEDKLNDIFKKPVSLADGQLLFSAVLENPYFSFGQDILSKTDFNSTWSLVGIPLFINFRNERRNGVTTNNFSIQFDRDQYLSELKNKLQRNINPQRILQSVPDPLLLLKTQAQRLLSRDLSQLNEKYHNLLNQKIAQLGDLQNLFKGDIQLLKQQLITPELLSALHQKEALFDQLRTKKNIGQTIDTMQYQSLENSILELKGVQEIVSKIEEHKKSWESSGLLTKIRQCDILKSLEVNKILSDPSIISSMARQELSLNGLQKLFLKLNRLRIGENTLSSSSLSFQNFLNNGSWAEFVNHGKSALFFIGNGSDNRSIYDLPFANTAFGNSMAKSIQLGKSNSLTGSTNVSVATIDQGFDIAGLPSINDFRHTTVITINRKFLVGPYGNITAEISKSISAYNSDANKPAIVSNMSKLLSSEDMGSNTSVILNYRDELPKYDVSYQLKLTKIGTGYDNPGNPFLNSGTQGIDLSVRKKLFKNKLLLSLSSNIKELSTNTRTDNKWQTMYSVLDLRFNMKKGQFISIRYLPTSMDRFDSLGKTRVTTFNRLAIDGNVIRKIGQINYSNYFNLSYQKNQYEGGGLMTGNTSLEFIANQNIIIGSKVVYWSIQLNQSIDKSALIYYNSSLNSEIGSSYSIGKIVQATTGIAYNEVTDWYKQLALRQSISMRWKERFDLSFFLDVRKNLQLYQPVWFGQTSGNITLHYLLKSK